MTEPYVAYVAVRRPDAKHRKCDYRRAPEVTAHPKAEDPYDPLRRGCAGLPQIETASSGSSNTSCNVVSNKRVSHESPQRTDSHYNDKEPKEKPLNDSATE